MFLCSKEQLKSQLQVLARYKRQQKINIPNLPPQDVPPQDAPSQDAPPQDAPPQGVQHNAPIRGLTPGKQKIISTFEQHMRKFCESQNFKTIHDDNTNNFPNHTTAAPEKGSTVSLQR